jgi:hypothetical protein
MNSHLVKVERTGSRVTLVGAEQFHGNQLSYDERYAGSHPPRLLPPKRQGQCHDTQAHWERRVFGNTSGHRGRVESFRDDFCDLLLPIPCEVKRLSGNLFDATNPVWQLPISVALACRQPSAILRCGSNKPDTPIGEYQTRRLFVIGLDRLNTSFRSVKTTEAVHIHMPSIFVCKKDRAMGLGLANTDGPLPENIEAFLAETATGMSEEVITACNQMDPMRMLAAPEAVSRNAPPTLNPHHAFQWSWRSSPSPWSRCQSPRGPPPWSWPQSPRCPS